MSSSFPVVVPTSPVTQSRRPIALWGFVSAIVALTGLAASLRPAPAAGFARSWVSGAAVEAAPAAPTSAPPNVPPLTWVAIPGGAFRMGGERGEADERPVHTVTLKAFELTRTEVTVEQYAACVNAGACSAPETGQSCNWGVAGRASHPINCVYWDQAQAFGRWAGGRLPTEAEWEYAARSGGKDIAYPWGNEAANYGAGSTAEVCGKGEFGGICDMAGNVWEWVEDWYHSRYVGAPADGSAYVTPAGSSRVARGGSWTDSLHHMRARNRDFFAPGGKYANRGFRLARSPASPSSP